MVHMTPTRSGRTSDAAVLEAFKSASSMVTMEGGSLFDQLVALECAERGGAISAEVARKLRVAGDEAESQLAAHFEVNLPSVSLLAQLVAARDAGGKPAPIGSGERLQTAVEVVTKRAAPGLEAKPHLLAAVVRSFGILDLTLSETLRQQVESAVDSLSDPIALADLLDALSRIRSQKLNARSRIGARLLPHQNDSGGALAVWWLAQRWLQVHGEQVIPEESLDRLRLTALTADYSGDWIAAAFMAEAAARDSADLRLIRTSASDRAIARFTRRHLLTYYTLWLAVITGLAVIGLATLSWTLNTAASALSQGAPSRTAEAGAASVLFGVIGLAVGLYLARLYKLISGKEPSSTATAIGVAVVTLAASALGAFVYSH